MVDGYSYRRESEHTSEYSFQSSHFGSANQHPSFSSTLLDAIYRSIDQGEEEVVNYREAMRKKQSGYGSEAGDNLRGVFKSEEEMANFQRACMIEKWMEKKVGERRKSVADLQMKKPRKAREDSISSSSDSSCGGGFFSSSEAESFTVVQRPKPIRTGSSGFQSEKTGQNRRDTEFNRRDRHGYGDDVEPKPKHEGGFLKTKSRALKIYGDLKKVKQPISPGGKLAGFINSLFTGANPRKSKIAANSAAEDSPSLKFSNASTCSSASSFSRSCLSKTPSSSGGLKSSTSAAKRSVRFSPVSVIVDDDRQHRSQHSKSATTTNNNDKINSIRNVINEELMVHIMEKNRRVEEVARDLLRNYQIKNQLQNFDHEDEEDDAASCASSDLFELDNLSAIGMERYREELPVYETTDIQTNRAVTNGLIL